jgi:hypothetical protein
MYNSNNKNKTIIIITKLSVGTTVIISPSYYITVLEYVPTQPPQAVK